MSNDLIHELQKKITILQAHIRDLETKNADLKKKDVDLIIMPASPDTNNANPDLFFDLHDQINKLNVTNIDQEKKCDTLNEQIKSLENQIIYLKQAHNTETEQLKKRHEDELKEEHRFQQKNFSNQLDMLKGSHEDEIEKLNNAHKEEIETQRINYQQLIDKLEKMILDLKETIKHGNDTTETLKRQLSTLNQDLKHRDTLIQMSSRKETKNDDQVIELELKNSDMKSQLIEKEREIIALKSKVSELTVKIEEIKSKK